MQAPTISPKVSVAIITYKHERFIEQCLTSALKQQTDFDFEIVIGEDKSPDSTGEIVESFRRSHPDKIRVLIPEENQGAVRNLIGVLGACKGQYIALLEGDDYWSSDQKLQTQADYLDAHPDIVGCFTGTEALDEKSGQITERILPHVEKAQYGLFDLFDREFFPTAATMFRRGLFKSLPEWFPLVRADFVLALHILNAEHGNFARIDRDMAVYRRHGGGMYSATNWVIHQRWLADAFTLIDTHFGYRYSRAIGITKRNFRVASALAGTDPLVSRTYLLRALRSYPRDPNVPLRKLIGQTVHMVQRDVKRVFFRAANSEAGS